MIKKTCTATPLALAISTITATGTARADRPAVRGCAGSSLSAAAQQPAPFGQFISGLARDPESQPGVADNTHALAAGGYTDEQFINTYD